MTASFQAGDWVTFTGPLGLHSTSGKIIAAVPKGIHGRDVFKAIFEGDARYSFEGAGVGQQERESYLVRCGGGVVYWPQVETVRHTLIGEAHD